MYRLTLYYLIGLIAAAVVLSMLKLLPYNPLDILLDTFVAVIVSLIANNLFAKFFHAVTNYESVYITALILVLISPVAFPRNLAALIVVCIFAMGSKYFVTIEKRHIFNPAAAAVLGLSLISDHSATWWVGTPSMMPFVLIGGLLLVRKIQREAMVWTFLLSYVFLVIGAAYWHSGTLSAMVNAFKISMLQSALLFFAFVMFTEPLTSPATEKLRKWYSYVVAILYATPQLRLLPFALTPEMALCFGNVFSYFVSPNYRLALPLLWKQTIGNVGIFAFVPASAFNFTPGQYMEWTLPHEHVDSRGNRRYFSLASSPTEKELLLAVKFYDPSSSYKKQLQLLPKGGEIIASSLAGDFTLPKNVKKSLVFLAGGIGIAPFRSMIQYIVDKKLQVDIVVFYANRTVEEMVFHETLTKAQANGVKTVYVLTDSHNAPADWVGETGHVDAAMIQKYVPDYTLRTYYISGPQSMVESSRVMLEKFGIPSKQIKQDFFPGYSE